MSFSLSVYFNLLLENFFMYNKVVVVDMMTDQ